ncbi:ParB/RepB/Spo0J family partition protein [Streptococcus ictaluri]|uniref:ParB-like protein n=1 Tax=Streptococcus ictaluri 707-05 TaxID=764299 RepID=G5K0K9_9STRE|nr:ParB/RepB/Spo0J family partition protein [Streptococcus ictaluri]EHI70521.1 ParB-like protein [Streptococcus ictaluri 707-05]
MKEVLIHIPIEDIVANPYQPRLQFNQKELDDLANSIKMNGLIQPIIVRKSKIFGYELVAGERRFKASKIAGLKQLPAIVKEMSNLESMQQAIVENLQRSDLNAIEEAKAYQLLIEENKLTHEEVAKYMGKSRPYISNTLRLLQLPVHMIIAVEKGQISAGHARTLLALSDSKTQEYWFKKIIEDGLSVRQLEDIVKSGTNKKTHSKPKDIFCDHLEKKISKSLGLPSSLQLKKDGSGHVQLVFSNEEELNRIINKLI